MRSYAVVQQTFRLVYRTVQYSQLQYCKSEHFQRGGGGESDRMPRRKLRIPTTPLARRRVLVIVDNLITGRAQLGSTNAKRRRAPTSARIAYVLCVWVPSETCDSYCAVKWPHRSSRPSRVRFTLLWSEVHWFRVTFLIENGWNFLLLSCLSEIRAFLYWVVVFFYTEMAYHSIMV